jgi:hypothetical protein
MAMADVSYVPGALTAVAGDQCWALVETSPDSPAVTKIWQQLGQGVAVDALLATLIAEGIGGTPGFTLLLAEPGGRHRLFCRGTLGATVLTASPDGNAPAAEGRAVAARIDAAGLLTWREHLVDGAQRIFLGEPPADTAMRLPATSGVLLAGGVIIDLTSLAARDTVSYQEGDPRPQEKPRKTIVFFPDTMTMTHPGSLAEQAARAASASQRLPDDRAPLAAPAPAPPFPPGPVGPFGAPGSAGAPGGPSPVAGPGHAAGRGSDDGEHDFPWALSSTVIDPPVGEGGQNPSGAFTPGGAVMPAGYPGTGPQPTGHYQSAPYQGVPPPGAQPWQTPPNGAWVDGAPAGAPMPTQPPGPLGPAAAMPEGPVGGLIDAPPWLSGPAGPARAGPAPSGPAPFGPAQAGPMPGGPGQISPAEVGSVPTAPVILGQAPIGPVPGGPVAGGPAPVEPPYQPLAPLADPGPGDSGSTVKRAELPDPVARTIPPDRIGPVVPALLCPSGHVNPPSGAVCRRCGAPLPHDPVPVPRPVLGVLRLSLGDVITLDRGVLMGRNPRTDFAGTEGEERPHVVKLPSAGGDISRTHLRVTLDGWHVLVTDLNSTNGTLVTLPGREAQQLRPGEPVPIQPGTVVTLADDIDFRYEVTD